MSANSPDVVDVPVFMVMTPVVSFPDIETVDPIPAEIKAFIVGVLPPVIMCPVIVT